MMMTKPAFGDVRAPRQWNETADRALTVEVGLLKRKLDGCIYISVREANANANDDPFEIFEAAGKQMIVDGVLGLHVDDIIAAGEHIYNQDDIYKHEPKGEPTCYAERLYVCWYIVSSLGASTLATNKPFVDADCLKPLTPRP